MHVAAIIPGAGKGLRFSGRIKPGASVRPKQFQTFADQPLIFHTLQPFIKSKIVDTIVLAVPEDSITWISELMDNIGCAKDIHVIAGGKERQDSVLIGLNEVKNEADIVVVHDAVRPFVWEKWINETVELCSEYDGAIIAVKAKDTLKKVSDRKITCTLDRSEIWQAQTPQTFNVNLLISAYENAEKHSILGTDEAQLVELNGGQVAIVEGSADNIKITTPEDWRLAEHIMRNWSDRAVMQEAVGSMQSSIKNLND